MHACFTQDQDNTAQQSAESAVQLGIVETR